MCGNMAKACGRKMHKEMIYYKLSNQIIHIYRLFTVTSDVAAQIFVIILSMFTLDLKVGATSLITR